MFFPIIFPSQCSPPHVPFLNSPSISPHPILLILLLFHSHTHLTPPQISGYYDFDDTEISISPTLGGSSIGPRYTAGLKTGIKFGIDLWAAKGEVRIFESGNKLKIGYTLGTWFTEKSDEAVLLDLGN
jgi:hypothetical protein